MSPLQIMIDKILEAVSLLVLIRVTQAEMLIEVGLTMF